MIETMTERGFVRVEFRDRDGAQCSLEQSSTVTESTIWLGIDRDEHGTLVPTGRMHLTQETVRELLPYLKSFAKSGELG